MRMFRKKWKSNVRLDGKTAIITGCNTGIGKYNALDFYRRGCRVIMACRDLMKGEQAKEDIMEELRGVENLGSLYVEKLDLSSMKSVKQFARTILEKERKIHILVNNAGVMGAEKTITEDGFELHLGTNHLGHFLLTLLLLPRIIDSAPARIVNVSSLAHAIGRINFEDINSERRYSSSSAYAQSKLANILFTKELARRLDKIDVHVYAVHPGTIRTDLGRHLKRRFLPVVVKLFDGVAKCCLKSIKEGTQTQIYCAIDEEAGKQTGLYYSNCRVATPSVRARNMETAKKLWDLSVTMVGMEGFDPIKYDSHKPISRERKVISFHASNEEDKNDQDTKNGTKNGTKNEEDKKEEK